MKICIVTDEISADPETAVELGAQWGVKDFELRGYFADRVPLFSKYQKQRVRDFLDEHDAHIVAISPGLFKIPYPPLHPPSVTLAWMGQNMYETWAKSNDLARYHLEELLPASLDYANELGASRVLIFSFDRQGAPPGDPPEEIFTWLLRAAERAGKEGQKLVLENELGFWADTGANTASIIEKINHPALEANWDPGNAFFAGETPFPDGYSKLKGMIGHIHYKDAKLNQEGHPIFSGEGDIDWVEQITALIADGYKEFVSIETHISPKVAAARSALDRLRTIIGVS